tara:strand:+ start:37377 stop:38849 length:1473 start_codon:yes stop_codon:yes gene_type:complete
MYYFRRGIPAPLRSIIGKREFLISLGVKDREQAKRMIPQYTTETQAILDAAASHGPDTAPSPMRAAADFALWQNKQEAAEYQYQHSMEQEEAAIAREPLVSALEQKLKLSVDKLSPEEQAAKDIIDNLKFELKLSQEKRMPERAGGERPENSSNAKGQLKQSGAAGPVSSAQTSISAMYEGYATQPGLREATVRQFRSIINHLINFLGHDIANQVSSDDLIRWRQFLQKEAAVKGKPRSAQTINNSYLAAASVTFDYGFNERLIPKNPVALVGKVRAEKKIRLRSPDFTKAERKAILSASLSIDAGRRSAQLVGALRWVPWLCAYTGARVNEMTQLRREDITKIDDVWAVEITPVAGDVKTDEARLVPIHEHLIEQGFLEYIDACPEGPLFYDPDKSGVGLQRGQYKRVGMRLAEWVRGLGIGQVGDRSLQPNHAWRHTFKTICLEAGIEERAMDYMQGHASRGVGRTYGSNTLPMLQVQLAKFPRFELG